MEKRDELRALIVKYKNEGHSFVEISDILWNKHGIKRDRQAIYGMYKRAVERESKEGYDAVMRIFVLGLRNIGYNLAQITELAEKRGMKDLTYYKVRQISKNLPEDKDSTKRSNILKVARIIKEGGQQDDLCKALAVHDINPTEASLDWYIMEATKVIIANEAEKHLIRAYKLMTDKDKTAEIMDGAKEYSNQARIKMIADEQ